MARLFALLIADVNKAKGFDKLVTANLRMVMVSLSMDFIIIGMLSYRNDLV